MNYIDPLQINHIGCVSFKILFTLLVIMFVFLLQHEDRRYMADFTIFVESNYVSINKQLA